MQAFETSGGLAEIMFQKSAQAFPAGYRACGRAGFIFRSNGLVAKRLMRPFCVIKFHIVADCQTQRFFSDGNKAIQAFGIECGTDHGILEASVSSA